MPLSKAHKAKSRRRIIDAAAALFRDKGYDHVSVDAVMAAAGMTRGGFYAHFDSKAALFVAVLEGHHGLLQQLRDRPKGAAAERQRAAIEIFDAYLDPAHFDQVRNGCSLAALPGDAGRDLEARTAYETAFRAVIDEVAADAPAAGRDRVIAAVTLGIGAIAIASALKPGPERDQVLRAANAQVKNLVAATPPQS